MIGALLILSIFLTETFTLQGVQSDSYENISDDLQKISPKASDDSIIRIDGRLTDNISSYYPFITGSGTLLDPYTLANMHINSSQSDNAIFIENVVDYFHITNMTIVSTEFGGANIKLKNCENISIYNNYLSAAQDCIKLVTSSNILVDNNTITNSPYHGLNLFFSNQVNISNNHISSTYYGIIMSGGENNVITSNNLSNNGRVAISSFYSYSSNLSIHHNTFINNENGIFLVLTEDSLIEQNIFSYNKKIAIGLYSSNRNNISSNFISNSRYGVAFEFPWVNPEGSSYSSPDEGTPVDNILYNNTLTDISIKPIKFWLGRNEAINNHFEQNFWSAILIFLICGAPIGLISISTYLIIRKRSDLKRKLKAYESAVDQKDKIEALEKELEDYKQKFFELKTKLT